MKHDLSVRIRPGIHAQVRRGCAINKTSIEWVKNVDGPGGKREEGSQGLSWNPLSGCLRGCYYCYAMKIATRFAGTKAFPRGFEPTWHPERLDEPGRLRKPSTIFVGSMCDLFGPWVPNEWITSVIVTAHKHAAHLFIFLTKYPRRLLDFRFPRNAWVGITVDRLPNPDYEDQLKALNHMTEPGVRFISFEPLLALGGSPGRLIALADWVIVGSQTRPDIQPPEGAVGTVAYHCSLMGKPLFLKNNLRLPEEIKRRQEFPVVADG